MNISFQAQIKGGLTNSEKKNQVEPNEAAQDFQRGMDLAEEAMLMEAMEEAPKSRDKTAGFFWKPWQEGLVSRFSSKNRVWNDVFFLGWEWI